MYVICALIVTCVGIIDLKSRWGRGSGLYVADIDVCQAGLHNCFGNSTCTYKGTYTYSKGKGRRQLLKNRHRVKYARTCIIYLYFTCICVYNVLYM